MNAGRCGSGDQGLELFARALREQRSNHPLGKRGALRVGSQVPLEVPAGEGEQQEARPPPLLANTVTGRDAKRGPPRRAAFPLSHLASEKRT